MTEKGESDERDILPGKKGGSGRIKADRLWAPWRMKYIEEASRGEELECFLCENPKVKDCADNLILCRGRRCFVIMNLYPYNNGHLMVAPFRHVSEFLDLTPEETAEVGVLTKLCIRALNETMHPHGFNIGMNLGRVAGAGLEDHLHVHIVPRWDGDTNFMPIIAETKVISESLQESYKRLRKVFDKMK